MARTKVRFPVTDEERREILQLSKQREPSLSFAQIGAAVGRHKSVVERICNKKTKRARKNAKTSKIIAETVQNLRSKFRKKRKIGSVLISRACKLGRTAICKHLRASAVPERIRTRSLSQGM
jgi:hypothetical protein